MRYIYKILLLLVALFVATSAFSQKPQWVGNTPKELNYTYKLVEVVSNGSDLAGARANALENLAGDRLLTEGVRIYQNTIDSRESSKVKNPNQTIVQTKNTHTTVTTHIDGSPVQLSALRVDEYATQENGMVKLHTLFQVATCSDPVFDNVYVTDKYDFSARVFVPGWAQLYKGSIVKGACIIAAEAVGIGGIVYTESMRAAYMSRVYSQPSFAKEYKNKADNFEIARNCCIGAAVAIYVYNLIDAIVAPGVRRVVVTPRNLQLTTSSASDFNGIGLSYSF